MSARVKRTTMMQTNPGQPISPTIVKWATEHSDEAKAAATRTLASAQTVKHSERL